MGWNLKKLLNCGILHQHPQIFLETKFQPKTKILKFGTKTALIGYFWLEFQKSNVVFEISILEFVNMLIFMQKQENFKLGSKIPYLGTCGLQFNKNYYQIFNQHPRIWQNLKFHPKQKNIFLGPKMLYLGHWAGMLKNYCHICNQRPPVYLMAKFRAKIRIFKFGTKNALFGCFGQQFWKAVVIFEISTLQFPLLQSLVQKIEIL